VTAGALNGQVNGQAGGHPYVLRAPWYDREREKVTPFDAAARRPVVQKYATADFVDRLLADPRESLAFGPEDQWTYTVPVATTEQGGGRRRFASHRLVRTPLRKLFQPSHERYYAVAVELFCDEPGLPRPGIIEGIETGFVIRRERVLIRGKAADVRELARDLAIQLDTAQNARTSTAKPIPDTSDLEDLAWAGQAAGHPFTTRQLELLEAIRPTRVVEAWVPGPAGRGVWRKVDDTAPALLDGEQEQPMWPLPPEAARCDPARTRSLWFGVLPTFSAEVDELGAPKLDDRAIYRVRCFARRPPPEGREHCPPEVWLSDPTEPYRLAAFMDPVGTSNHAVTVTAPDFRVLAARAGEPPGPGGVTVVQPPGSQLSFSPLGGIPTSGTLGGDVASTCTFALELPMIVAMFLFGLFMPIVVFIFQLWWLLALRFCWPRPNQAIELLETHFANVGDISTLAAAGLADELDDLLDTPGATARLGAVAPFAGSKAVAADLLASVDPAAAATAATPDPEPVPDDPLCPAPGP
jgi:hypothetical protein